MCDRFPRKFDVQTSQKCVRGLIFVVNIKFPRATYHMIVPSTKELYCLNRHRSRVNVVALQLQLLLNCLLNSTRRRLVFAIETKPAS